MISSSSQNTWLLKYFDLVIGALSIILGVFILFKPQQIQVNEYEYYTTSLFEAIVAICIGTIWILKHKLRSGKVVSASLNHSKIILDDIEYSWLEVESIKRIRFISPPAYKLITKETNEVFIFTTESTRGRYFELSTPWFNYVWDVSRMGKAIKKIKKAYSI